MNLNKYSTNQEYEFEVLPDDLGFFERRSLLREKMSEKSENTLFYVQKNKVLSVEVEDDMIGWLQYEKALFFYNLFQENQKYVLISENDSYFYGYIDGFPCIFKNNYDEAIEVLNEYGDGEKVFQYVIGRSLIEYSKIKTLQEVCSLLNLSTDYDTKCVMEDTNSYYGNTCGCDEFSNLLFKWKNKLLKLKSYKIKKSCYFVFAGVFFLILGYFINHH